MNIGSVVQNPKIVKERTPPQLKVFDNVNEEEIDRSESPKRKEDAIEEISKELAKIPARWSPPEGSPRESKKEVTFGAKGKPANPAKPVAGRLRPSTARDVVQKKTASSKTRPEASPNRDIKEVIKKRDTSQDKKAITLLQS